MTIIRKCVHVENDDAVIHTRIFLATATYPDSDAVAYELCELCGGVSLGSMMNIVQGRVPESWTKVT